MEEFSHVLDATAGRQDMEVAGIIRFYDIWSKFDFPDDSPLMIQGVNNNIPPEDYYSLKNYKFLYNEHLKWINKNIEFLNNKT